MTAKKCSVLFLISLHLLCTGMNEARALVRALCSCSVSPVSSPLLHVSLVINDLFLISLHLLCMGMDEACALVHALCSCSASPVSSPLLHASMLINVVFCSSFHYTCCARAWMRHAPWYVPCALQCVSCVVASTACVTADKCSVLLMMTQCWLCTGMDETRALVRGLCNSSVSRVSLLCNMF